MAVLMDMSSVEVVQTCDRVMLVRAWYHLIIIAVLELESQTEVQHDHNQRFLCDKIIKDRCNDEDQPILGSR